MDSSGINDIALTVAEAVKEAGLSEVLSCFSLEEIANALNHSGKLREFLLQVPPQELKQAADEIETREREAVERERRNRAMRHNVLDFTLKDLAKHCRRYGYLPPLRYGQFDEFTLENDHRRLAMYLIGEDPDKYYIGEKSRHFNHAARIERIYGIRANQDDHDDDDEGSGQDGPADEESFIVYDQQDEQEQEQDDDNFVHDQGEQSNYSIYSEQKLQGNSGARAMTKQSKGDKNKKITKQNKRTNKRKLSRQSQSQNVRASKKPKQNKEEDIEISKYLVATSSKTEHIQKSASHTNKKRTLDSDSDNA